MIIISNALNSSSSGLVVKHFIEKARYHEHHVIGVFEEVSVENRGDSIYWLDQVSVFSRISKVCLILFGISPKCFYRANQAYTRYLSSNLTEEKNAYVFLTSVNFFTIYLLKRLKRKKSHLKIHVHFLDTYISNNSWGENKYVTNAKKRFIKSKLSNEIGSIEFSFTNDKAKKLMQSIFEKEFQSKLFYSYPVNDYMHEFKPQVNKQILIYFRGTLDAMRNSDFILVMFNKIANLIPNVHFIFQGRISTNLELKSLNKLEIREFSTSIELLHEADIFLDIDLYLADVFIPGKFFEYLAFKKPILSITPFGSAMRGLIEKDLQQNNLIVLSDFNYSGVLYSLQNLLNRFQTNDIGHVSFNKIETLESLIIGADK